MVIFRFVLIHQVIRDGSNWHLAYRTPLVQRSMGNSHFGHILKTMNLFWFSQLMFIYGNYLLLIFRQL